MPFNPENLFDRPEAFNEEQASTTIEAVKDMNVLFEKPVYRELP